MRKAKNSTSLFLAIVLGATSFVAIDSLRAAADPSDLVPLCFRNKTILVPTYLRDRYLAVAGTLNGPCPSTP
jgi:hypothetical protein